MAQNLEDIYPPIQSAGLNTQKNATFGGTVSVSGAFNYLNNLVNANNANGTNPTLTTGQSGSTVLMNSTSGTLITLPAPKVGLTYEFIVASDLSTGTHKVITDAATTYIYGALIVSQATNAATIPLVAVSNATNIIAVAMNGTTSGGSIGTIFTLTCTSTNAWAASGVVAGTGVLATPFSTV